MEYEMTVKEELHALVERLSDTAAVEVLDYVEWLASAAETLSAEDLAEVERGEAEIARGEYVTLAELRQTLGK